MLIYWYALTFEDYHFIEGILLIYGNLYMGGKRGGGLSKKSEFSVLKDIVRCLGN